MLPTSKISFVLNKYKGLLGVLPALIFVFLFFIGGFFQALYISLGGYGEYYGEHQEFSWAYKELVTSSFLKSLFITVGLSALIALLSGGIGIITALLLATSMFKKQWVHFLLQLPVGVPHLLAGYLLTQVFMGTGLYSRVAYHLGLIASFEQFPAIIHDQWGLGMIFAYLWKEIPFIVLLVFPFLTKLLADWQETATLLGATAWQSIRWVIIPMILPLWVGGMWIVFAFTLGAYEIPALLARTSLKIIPVVAWQEYTQFGLERQPVAIAMNVILAGISLLIGICLLMLQKRWYEKGRRLWRD